MYIYTDKYREENLNNHCLEIKAFDENKNHYMTWSSQKKPCTKILDGNLLIQHRVIK